MAEVHRSLVVAGVASLAALACLAVRPAFVEPVTWTPDALYYQARVLELRGADEDEALARVFEGPLSAELRRRDPGHTGDAEWVAYNAPFYERRVAVPLAAAALYPAAEERSLLYVSLAGYVAAIVALFGLLLLRFRLAVAFAVAAAAAFLPPLVHHASFPLTDSWGLALGLVAFAAAILTLDRGLRWLALWVAALVLLSLTRDSTWVPILAAGWCAVRYRSRAPTWLFATGLASTVPALLLFTVPVRDLLALLVNDSEPSADTSWSFIASEYPGAVVELARANAGFLRRGEWYTALFLAGGLVALAVLARRRRRGDPATPLMVAGAVFGIAYVLAAPVFSAFRLELVLVPAAAYGLALAAEWVLEHAAVTGRLRARLPARATARPRRS